MSRPSIVRHPLAALRREAKIGQGQLAEVVGCAPRTIKAIENLQRPLSERIASKVADRFGVSLSWLLAGDQNAPIPTAESTPTRFKEFSGTTYKAHCQRRKQERAKRVTLEDLPTLDVVMEMARQDFTAILRVTRAADADTVLLCFHKIADGLNALAKILTAEFGIDADYQVAMLENLTTRLYGAPDENAPTFESIPDDEIDAVFTREEIETSDRAFEKEERDKGEPVR